MQLIEGQMFFYFLLLFLIKRWQIDKIELEYRVLELEGQIKMEEMCF